MHDDIRCIKVKHTKQKYLKALKNPQLITTFNKGPSVNK